MTTGGMLDAMQSVIGLAEYPDGSNHNSITVWYGMDGQPWCDMTITYAAYQSGNQDAVCFGSKFAYTVAHAQAFQKHGEWHQDVGGIQTGDIVFFDWGQTKNIAAIDHVGIVTNVDPDGTVHTIEGNIDNKCQRMLRYANVIVGYGRPAYFSPPPPPVMPPPVPQPQPKLPFVDLAVIIAAAKSKTGHVKGSDPMTALVQNGLAKLGLVSFTGRGEFGPLTRSGYAAFQRSLGFSGSDADGIPGCTSLRSLGAKSNLFTCSAVA